MVVLIKKQGDTKDALLKKFSRMFIEENIVDEVRRKLFYKKPSIMRKEKEKERLQRKNKVYSRSRA